MLSTDSSDGDWGGSIQDLKDYQQIRTEFDVKFNRLMCLVQETQAADPIFLEIVQTAVPQFCPRVEE
jgi:hypothetical protein